MPLNNNIVLIPFTINNSNNTIMNDFYHVCMTAHSEVILRSEDDARDITNLIALSAFRSGTQILVDAIMSNHMHFIVLYYG